MDNIQRLEQQADEKPLKPSKKFDWFFEPYELAEPSELKSAFCPKCYAKVNSENNIKQCGCCGQFLMWEGYDG